MSPIRIRLLAGADAEEWWRLRLESLQSDPQAFSASADDGQSLTLDEVRKRFDSDAADFFVMGAFEDGKLVGMSGFHRERGAKTRHKARVWGVFVTPQSRGKGLGRSLLKALLDRAIGIYGVEQILLSVATTQSAAIGLYRSLGFQSYGCEPRALKVGGRFIDEEYMARPNRPRNSGPTAQD
jgi:ribosomal protein S18 acetylase RimI-like enzyme